MYSLIPSLKESMARVRSRGATMSVLDVIRERVKKVQSEGHTIVDTYWGLGYNDDGKTFLRQSCCPMAAVVGNGADHSDYYLGGKLAAEALGVSQSYVYAFTRGFDGTNSWVLGINSESDQGYKDGCTMREELGFNNGNS
jgi:hypothetical protein